MVMHRSSKFLKIQVRGKCKAANTSTHHNRSALIALSTGSLAFAAGFSHKSHENK